MRTRRLARPPGGQRRPLSRAVALGMGALAALAVTALGGFFPAEAASPWWQLAGFAGQPVTRVAVVQGRLTALVDGRAVVQREGGFAPAPASPPPPAARVTVGSRTWSIDAAGQVLVARGTAPPAVDPGSPDLGVGAHLIAAPLVTPGVVVAVSTSGTVWRRAPGGGWAISLVLLPDTLVTGTPAVTSLAAFSASTASSVIYLGTDGYGTLLSSDGGDDWVRANPGIPDGVLSLVADSSGAEPAIWAGTAQGLYVHHLQSIPSVPNYSGGSLTGKWLLTALVCGLVLVIASAALVAWSHRRGAGPVPTHS